MKIEYDRSELKREIKVSGEKGGIAVIYFINGKFDKCEYNIPNDIYRINDWKFLGEISDFLSEIQTDEDIKEEEYGKEYYKDKKSN